TLSAMWIAFTVIEPAPRICSFRITEMPPALNSEVFGAGFAGITRLVMPTVRIPPVMLVVPALASGSPVSAAVERTAAAPRLSTAGSVMFSPLTVAEASVWRAPGRPFTFEFAVTTITPVDSTPGTPIDARLLLSVYGLDPELPVVGVAGL